MALIRSEQSNAASQNPDVEGIFISYRRSGTRADTGRLYDRLAGHYGDDHVFMDIDDIKPGQNFEQVLQDTLAGCQVMLVLIGPHWLDTRDEAGRARLQDEADFVRLEVKTALQRDLPVIPVLVDRAVMPSADDLPPDMGALASRQAHEISDTRFHEDVNALIEALNSFLAPTQPSASRYGYRRWTTAIVLAAVVFAAGLGVFWRVFLSPDQGASLESQAIPVMRSHGTVVSEAELLQLLVAQGFYDATRNPGEAGANASYDLTVVEGNAAVVDPGLRLAWQQSGIGRQRSVAQALERIQWLNGSAFGGYSDWRLPTLDEAMSLLSAEAVQGAHIASLFAPAASPVIWTADRRSDEGVWVVYLYDGTAAVEAPDFNAWVRAVRNMQ